MTTLARRRPACIAAVVGLIVVATFRTGGEPSIATSSGPVIMPVAFPLQAMGGNLQLAPGASLSAGYSFTMPGPHPDATVSIVGATVTFPATCKGPGGGTISISLGSGPYDDPAASPAWLPSGDQASTTSYQGSTTIPDLCSGGPVSLAKGGSLVASVQSTDASDPVNVRWHYSGNGSNGGWSGTQSARPGVVPPAQPTQIVVKVDLADGYTIADVQQRFSLTIDDGGLASRGIYLVEPTTPLQPGALAAMAKQIASMHGVLYAQTNQPIVEADREFYGWPYGSPTVIGTLPSQFTQQPAATQLQLATAHATTQGAGIIVAVLDTGADPTAPALVGHLLPGWNYLDDDADTRDIGVGGGPALNAAVGHGTFVAGLVSLVAPQAQLLPEKVLNSNGYGTIWGAAQAILDATAAGAKVINLSFGTATQPTWNLLQDAIQQAHNAGVVLVAASGNDADNKPHYPASQPPAIGVAALNSTFSGLATFSDFGGWVDVAAPGQQVVGPLPGGEYATWAGTSVSTPLVSGQAALIRAVAPAFTPDKVLAALSQTATHLNPNPVHFGSINIPASLAFAATHH